MALLAIIGALRPPLAVAQQAPAGGASPSAVTSPSSTMAEELLVAEASMVASAAPARPGPGESALLEVAPPAQPTAQPLSQAVAQGPPPASASASASGSSAGLGSGISAWRLPPIKWGGFLALNVSANAGTDQERSSSVAELFSLSAQSYVWQPWFAQISGNLELSAEQQFGGSRSVASGAPSPRNIGGGIALSLLPTSPYPFTASFDERDSRFGGEPSDNDYRSRRYRFTQSYNPPRNGAMARYRLSFDRSELSSEVFGIDQAQAADFDMSWGLDDHSVNVNANAYRNRNFNSGDSSSLDRLDASYKYHPSSAFSLDTQANFNLMDYDLTLNGQPLGMRSQILQINSFATWKPRADLPLRLNGGARLLQSSAASSGAAVDARTISANLAAQYDLNLNVRLSASGVATQTVIGANEIFSGQVGAGADYIADTRKWGEYIYNWGGGARIGMQTGGATSGGSFNANLQHSLRRSIALRANGVVSVDGSQSFAAHFGPEETSSQSLSHRASATWNLTTGEGANFMLAASFADTRNIGYAAQHFQMINLQANGQVRLSRWSSFNANLTCQISRQDGGGSTGTGQGSATSSSGCNANGMLSYQNDRAFDVPRLRYLASLTFDQRSGQARLDGNIDGFLERIDWALEQRLDYDIGRLSARLTLRVAETAGKNNALLFFRVQRQFGGM